MGNSNYARPVVEEAPPSNHVTETSGQLPNPFSLGGFQPANAMGDFPPLGLAAPMMGVPPMHPMMYMMAAMSQARDPLSFGCT